VLVLVLVLVRAGVHVLRRVRRVRRVRRRGGVLWRVRLRRVLRVLRVRLLVPRKLRRRRADRRHRRFRRNEGAGAVDSDGSVDVRVTGLAA